LSSSFVFGFTGADKAGKRVGYVGLLPMDGAGNIAGGLLDTNDNGTANAYTSVTGTYVIANGVGSMTIAAGGSSFTFDLFGVGGTTNATNPLTLYAISTDPIDTNPAVAGSVVYQDSTQTYNNAALSKNEVINLTGVAAGGTNVSLTLASPDGKGHVGGTFDQNNAGTITTAQSFDSCVYNATGSGRYTISLLGNAGCKASSPFVLYARGLNQGFLLDQSSAAITGTMDLQKTSFVGDSDMFGPFTAGTESAASSGATPTVSNFLLTAGNPAAFGGTQYATGNASSALTGTYVMQSDGTGTVTLTQPASANLVIYAIDPVGGAGKDTSVAHFWIMDVTKGNANSSIAFAQR